MKKLTAILLCLLMVLMLAACGQDQPAESQPETQGSQPTQDSQPESQPTQDSQPESEPSQDTEPSGTEPNPEQADLFSFTFQGIQLTPGAAFVPDAMPKPDATYEIPSCAFEGVDTVYSYAALEVTACGPVGQQQIYSVFLVDVNTPTGEGIYMGDTKAMVIAAYGSGYVENGTEWVYTKGNTTLHLLFQGDTIISIEYRMA